MAQWCAARVGAREVTDLMATGCGHSLRLDPRPFALAAAYTTLGLVMLLPVGVLAALVLDGGATDHNVLPDAGEPGANQEDAARAAAAEAAPSAPLANSSTSDGVQMSTPERRTVRLVPASLAHGKDLGGCERAWCRVL